jgi:hypothetical protein
MPYGADCVTREGITTTYQCRRADQLTAVVSRGAIVALWTSQPKPIPATELRFRRLSLDGKPLGPSTALLPQWPAGDCGTPARLQAAALRGGRILVAWWSSCGTSSADGGAGISAMVIDGRGAVLRRPFTLVHVPPPPGGGTESPPFWLRATSTGRLLLAWASASQRRQFADSLFATFLTPDDRAGKVIEVEGGVSGAGVACAKTCVVARPGVGTIDLLFFAPGKGVAAGPSIRWGPASLSSDPIAAANGNRFLIGWLESTKGLTATAHVATVAPGRAPTAATVAEHVPITGASYPPIPQPSGFVLREGRPALVWETSILAHRHLSFRLYAATPTGKTTQEADIELTTAIVPGLDSRAIVGIGSGSSGQPDPLSVPIP